MVKVSNQWSKWCLCLSFIIIGSIIPPGVQAISPLSPASSIHTDIYGSAIISDNLQIMVGYRGRIFRSEDGGKNWADIPSGTTVALFGVHFPDARNGWIVGKEGLVLHTTDGGLTWKKQTSGIKKHLFSVYFTDAKHGVAVGDWSALIQTENGGESWQVITYPEDVLFYKVAFFNPQRGCIVGEFGRILTTDDGGKTWKQMPSPADGYTLAGISINGSNACAVGLSGMIVCSGDMGRTWKRAKNELQTSLYGVAVNKISWAIGEKGTVLISKDGCESWSPWSKAKPGYVWIGTLSTHKEGKRGFSAGSGGRYQELSAE